MKEVDSLIISIRLFVQRFLLSSNTDMFLLQWKFAIEGVMEGIRQKKLRIKKVS